MATRSSVLLGGCMDRGAWRAVVHGSQRAGHDRLRSLTSIQTRKPGRRVFPRRLPWTRTKSAPSVLRALCASLDSPASFCSLCPVTKAKVKGTRSSPTLCDPMDCRPPGSSVRGISQARMLEWVALPFSRGSSQPKDQAQVSHIADNTLRWFLYFSQCITITKLSIKPPLQGGKFYYFAF